MLKVLNTTPHEINIFGPEQVQENKKIRKLILLNQDEKPIKNISPSGILLNAKIEYVFEKFEDGIPIFKMKVLGIDPIPDADIVIVSALYASAALAAKTDGLDRLYTVSQPIYESEKNLRPIGVLGLNKVV